MTQLVRSVSASEAHTRWSAVIALGLGAFVIVAAEFLPVGILPGIAGDFGVPLGVASSLVLIPGLVAGLAAPVVITIIGGADRRLVVISCTALLVVSNLMTWAAPSFSFLLLARVLVGFALGGFWAVGPSLGVRFATSRDARVATSVVLAGISAGTVLGLPLGQAVAESWGWRRVFLGAAVAGAGVASVQVACVRRPSGRQSRIDLRHLLEVCRRPTTRIVLITAILAITGQLMASTYISVLVAQNLGLDDGGASAMLLTYGAVGLLGNLLAGRFRVALRPLFGVTAGVLGIVFIGLPVAHAAPVVAICLTIAWGLLWGAFPFLLQSWMMTSTPDAPEAGSAVLVTCFQLSIALGSALGGVVISVTGIDGVFVIAGGFQLVAFALAVSPAVRAFRRRRVEEL